MMKGSYRSERGCTQNWLPISVNWSSEQKKKATHITLPHNKRTFDDGGSQEVGAGIILQIKKKHESRVAVKGQMEDVEVTDLNVFIFLKQ